MKKLASAVIARIERINTSTLDRANVILQTIAVGLLFFSFAFGTLTIVVGYILGQRQAANVAAANERAGRANRLAGEANERAAAANQIAERFRLDIATANERAAKANAVAESFRLDIAKANERAAAANRTAEKERVARLQLEARIADRVITNAQANRLIKLFAVLRGETVDVGVFGDSSDVATVSETLMRCLTVAGAHLQRFTPVGGGNGVRGVIFGVDPKASGAIKTAAESAVIVLRETLNGGVGLVDFVQLKYDGAVAAGHTEGAAAAGTGPLRVWIGNK